MGNCHDCKSFLIKTELSLGLAETTEENIAIISQQSKNFNSLFKVSPKIAALWRGHTERKLFLHIYKQSKPEYPYFDINEVKETLSINIGLAKFKEKRSGVRYKNGKYTGEWCGGFRHGYGVMEWNDGCKYEGHWQFSRPYGHGTFKYKNGDGYQGDWKVYYVFSKSVFKTGKLEQYKDCVQDGFLWLWITFHLEQAETEVKSLHFQIQSRHKSQLQEFSILKSSIFHQTLSSETSGKYLYTGPLVNSKRQGFGKLEWPEGKYEGQFLNNMQHGLGQIEWPDGNKYIGGFFKDMREGVGEFKWKAGNTYLGEWKNNFMHGFGQYTWKDGKDYLGSWKHGEREGYGVMKYNESKVYEGQFKDDKPNGIGVLKHGNEEFRGKWVNGKLAKD